MSAVWSQLGQLVMTEDEERWVIKRCCRLTLTHWLISSLRAAAAISRSAHADLHLRLLQTYDFTCASWITCSWITECVCVRLQDMSKKWARTHTHSSWEAQGTHGVLVNLDEKTDTVTHIQSGTERKRRIVIKTRNRRKEKVKSCLPQTF